MGGADAPAQPADNIDETELLQISIRGEERLNTPTARLARGLGLAGGPGFE